MQANVKKTKRFKEIDDRDDGPSDTFNSVVNEDSNSGEELDDFIRYFCAMTKLN